MTTKIALSSLPLIAVSTFLVVLLNAQMIVAPEGGVRVVCKINGVCKNKWTAGPVPHTVCTGCKSCTFENCCHKIFTDKHVKCPIDGGWHAKDYVGNMLVVDQISKQEEKKLHKRGTPCSRKNPCPDGQICGTFKKNFGTELKEGECRDYPWKDIEKGTWKEGENKNAFFALAAGILYAVVFL